MSNPDLSVFYVDDVKRILRCSDYLAREILKESGRSFLIGKKLAITVCDFYSIMQQKAKGKIITPEDNLRLEVR